MARVTVEDCIEVIPSHFELVVAAARRAKQIASGSPLTIERDNDKDAVVALREIADKTIDIEDLREQTIQSFQTRSSFDEFVSAPFAGEIADDGSESEEGEKDSILEAQQMLDEESDAKAMEAALDAPEGMSFADEDIDVDD